MFAYAVEAAGARAKGQPVAWREINDAPGNLWSTVRYMIELKVGLQKIQKKVGKGAASGSYIQGFFDDYREIPDDFVIRADTQILVKRYAMPPALRPFVPPWHDAGVEDAREALPDKLTAIDAKLDAALESTGDELERIRAVCKHDDALYTAMSSVGIALRNVLESHAKNFVAHPSAFRYKERVENSVTSMIPVPPDEYECPACLDMGDHFRADCLKVKDVEAEAPVDRVKVLVGVPLMFQGVSKTSKIVTAEGEAVGIVKNMDEALQKIQENPIQYAVCAEYVRQRDTTSANALFEFEAQLPRFEPSDDGKGLDFEPYLAQMEKRNQQCVNAFYKANPALRHKGTQCQYFLKGRCAKGWLHCEFTHSMCAKVPVCLFYLEDKCKKGDRCEFEHPAVKNMALAQPTKTCGLAPTKAKREAVMEKVKDKRRKLT